MNENSETYMKELADNLWQYFVPKIKAITNTCVRSFEATTVSVAAVNKVNIVRPFDDTVITLPCVTSMNGTPSGTKVQVLMFGDNLSNGFVIGNGMLTNL